MTKLIKYLKPVILDLLLGILFIAGQAYLDLQIPAQFVPLAELQGMGMEAGMQATMKIILKMLGLALASVACSVLAAYFTSNAGAKFGARLRKEMFYKVQNLSVQDVEKFSIASLITRTTNDVQQIQMLISAGMRIIVMAPVMIVGGLLNSLSLQKDFSIIFIVAIPLLLISVLIIGAVAAKMFGTVQRKVDALTGVAREGLTGVRVIRAFNQQEYEFEKYSKANGEVRDISTRVNRVMASLFPVCSLVMNMTLMGIVVVSTVIFNGMSSPNLGTLQANIGATSAVVGYSMQILGSIVGLSFVFMMIPRAQASASRINEVLDTPLSVADPANPVDLSQTEQKGLIEFRDVSFSYANAEKPILNHISFVSLPGQTTAIIGSTGSGKSTVASLIPRFFDPQEGEVLLDGVNVKNMTQRDLRDRIGFVPQSAVLFSGSVRENLQYGNPFATDEQLLAATDIAQATEFVMNTSDGLDHFISQGGKNLSGGQKQRLAIARAVVKQPEIYVFDDSFSALDFKTDAALRRALREQTQRTGSSVIIIAQRVSTVMDADQIIVLEEGNMVGIGKHQDLMKNCEEYREIVLSQINEEEANV